MGLFDLFKGGSKGGAAKPNAAAKYAERAGDKRAQNADRQEAIHQLAEMGTPEAVAALLKRFTFQIDPSIIDQDEKDAAFAGVLRAGQDALEPIRAFAAKAESLSWPMRLLKELLSGDDYVEELLLWLSKWDTEYRKFIDPKVQLLVALESLKHPKLRETVAPFLEDVNETARFHAAATTLAQDDVEAIVPLLTLLVSEESVRVRNKVIDGFIARSWPVPDDMREPVRKLLPYGISIDGNGQIKGRG